MCVVYARMSLCTCTIATKFLCMESATMYYAKVVNGRTSACAFIEEACALQQQRATGSRYYEEDTLPTAQKIHVMFKHAWLMYWTVSIL